jgi:hypothetical protein
MSELDQPEFFGGPDGYQTIPKDAKDNAAITEVFRKNELVMRRYVQSLGFDWAKHIYPSNMQKPYAHHNPEWTIEAALEFIEANKDGPFYLHITPTLLHGGQGSWRRSMDHPLSSGAGKLARPAEGMTPRAELLQELEQQGFDPDSPTSGEAWIDDAVGAILNKLKQLAIEEDTLVVFVADHGRDNKSSMLSYNGTLVPMMARWPGTIPPGITCDALVQNIDWAPTLFEIAETTVPDGYRIDGRSLLPLLDDGRSDEWREHLYFEMGYARAVTTKDWKYVAVRYPDEQIEKIKRSKPVNLPKVMSYIGRVGIGTRGADHAGFWDEDQLYDLTRDPHEHVNLAGDTAHEKQLNLMKSILKAYIEDMDRPFGEFVPGGNTSVPGQLDQQIERVKRLEIRGKNVSMPDSTSDAKGRVNR